jgi:glycosyltransferase involved in cell wall biosynthesis
MASHDDRGDHPMLTPTPRVLHCNPVGDLGGQEVVVLDIARELQLRGAFEPLVVTFTDGELTTALRAIDVPTWALDVRGARQPQRVPGAVLALRRLIRRERVALVHAHATTLPYAALATLGTGAPVVWHVYHPLTTREEAGEGGGTRVADRLAGVQRFCAPAWTIFITPQVRDSYLRAWPRLREHSVIYPGVDVDGVLDDADPARARATLGIPQDAPVVAMFARLTRMKGQLTLVEATPRILAAHPETFVVLVGGTVAGIEPEYAPELRRRVSQLGLERRVLLPGFVDDRTRRDILAAATVVAHPAAFEPFGLAVAEGLAAGKPLVVADAAGPAAIVEHGHSGLIVPRGDVDRLAAAIVELLDHPETATAMGCAARARARQFSVASMVEQVEGVYARVLGATG